MDTRTHIKHSQKCCETYVGVCSGPVQRGGVGRGTSRDPAALRRSGPLHRGVIAISVGIPGVVRCFVRGVPFVVPSYHQNDIGMFITACANLSVPREPLGVLRGPPAARGA